MPDGFAWMVPPWSTVMVLARMVSPLLVMSLALAMTSTAPATTTVPSIVVSVEMVSDGSTQRRRRGVAAGGAALDDTVHVVPVASQVSTLAPLQRWAPGVQPPVHRPAVQATVQFDDHSHAEPAELQISTALTLQR